MASGLDQRPTRPDGRGSPSCPGCGRAKLTWQRICKRRTCPAYGDVWARDWRRVLLDNLTAYGGPCVVVTVTAPGEDVLPWDRSQCVHEDDVRCSGRLGCRAADGPRRQWNATFPARWRKLHNAAWLAATREVGRHGAILCIGKEAQRRGALHAHVAVGTKTPLEAAWANAYARHLNRLRGEHGFGFVDRKLRARNAREAAAYLSRYFVSAAGKAPITEAVTNPEMPTRPLYCSPKLTHKTRVTMRNLRRVRHLWAWRAGLCPEPEWDFRLSVVVAYIESRMPVPAALAGA